MSPWDRRAAIRRYEAMFEETRDPEGLIEELGTPTKIAVELAENYVASPPPAEPVEPEPLPEPAPVRDAAPKVELVSFAEWNRFSEGETLDATPAPPKKSRGGLKALFWILSIVIGLPVAVLLICVGLPFLGAGAGLIAGVLSYAGGALAGFTLLSDMLFLGGCALILLALGVFLAWFGLWLSLTLCRLWIGGVIVRLGKKLYS